MIPIFLVLYKNHEVECRCLEHLRMHVDPLIYPRVVADNGPKNENLGALWNRMIEHDAPPAWYGEPDPVGLLLNTDCFILDDETLPKMRQAFAHAPNIGFVGPMTDHCGSEQKVTHPMWHQGWSKVLFEKQVMMGRYISGFCFMFRLSAYRDAGRFPEDGPFYGQESALLCSAFSKGWTTAIRLDTYVEHLGGSSVRAASGRGEMNFDEERLKGGAWFKAFRQRIKEEKSQ